MGAMKTIKILSFCLYLLYLLFFTIEAEGKDQEIGTIKTRSLPSRAPASFVVGEQTTRPPPKDEVWLKKVFVHDDGGILQGVKKNLDKWQKTEEYRKAWDIESTGLYNTPGRAKKDDYLRRVFLKYADKRLSGEIKTAERGTALHRIKTAEKALSPKVEAKVAKNVKIKFKARVLQRMGKLLVKNPLVDYHVSINTTGAVKMHLGRDIKALGLSAKIDYDANKGVYVAKIGKRISRNISSTLSSQGASTNTPFGQNTVRALKVSYKSRFP